MRATVKAIIAITAFLGLALPLWYNTLAVKRANISFGQLRNIEKNVDELVKTTVTVCLHPAPETPDLTLATQMISDKMIGSSGLNNWRIKYIEGDCRDTADLDIDILSGEGDDAIGIPTEGTQMAIKFSLQSLESGRVPEVVAGMLLDSIFHGELSELNVRKPGVIYAPGYHITWSLFSEGGDPRVWDIEQALKVHMGGLLAGLEDAVGPITMDSQVEYFAKPGCQGRELESRDLATFVNFAEWSLASSVRVPTLHFVLWLPEEPVTIIGAKSNSFVLPQWGGVVILNDASRHLTESELGPVMGIWSAQLLSLFGMPREPFSPQIRMDILARQSASRGLREAADSLGSLARLADSMPHIPIPSQVRKRVQEALEQFDEGCRLLNAGGKNSKAAVLAAGRAFDSAASAFFDKHMVAQAYFPDEHKLAVYAPLLGPMALVVVGGWLRFWKQRNLKLGSPPKAKAE